MRSRPGFTPGAPGPWWHAGSWAVGGTAGSSLVAHWNGHTWTQVPASDRLNTVGALAAVSAPSATDVWAAGGDINLHDYSDHTLIENVCPS